MPTPAPRRSNSFIRLWPWALALVLAGIALWWWKGHRTPGAGAQGYKTEAIDRGDIRVTISATGTLSAISTVTVGSQVSGQITDVLVDFNDVVKKGQVLARIDPATYEAQIEQGNAQIASAQAQLQQAQATLANASRLYARNAALGRQQLIAREDVDASRTAMEQAQAQVATARAAIRAQSAGTQTTRVNLGRTVIRSPVDGVVLTRKIEPGQTVAASMAAPELFTIAEDLSKMKIQLAVDESDIGQVKAGQVVSFTADAFPNRQFTGVVDQVQLAATTTSNVVTYPVVVTVDNSDGTLLPGLTVNAEIEVSKQSNVLRVANAALRFKPSDDAANQSAGSASEGGARAGMGSSSEDLKRIADSLQLQPVQQAAFNQAMDEMKARQAERQRQRAASGGAQDAQQGASRILGGGMGRPPGSGGGSGMNPAMQAQMRTRMRERMQQQFAPFRATLDASQRERWDTALSELVNAKRAPLYLLVAGKPKQVMVRVGVSDSSYTQVSGNAVKEGDLAITGQQAAAVKKK